MNAIASVARGTPREALGLLSRVAALVGVDALALERFHEPYLFRLGLATTTPNGRVALG